MRLKYSLLRVNNAVESTFVDMYIYIDDWCLTLGVPDLLFHGNFSIFVWFRILFWFSKYPLDEEMWRYYKTSKIPGKKGKRIIWNICLVLLCFEQEQIDHCGACTAVTTGLTFYYYYRYYYYYISIALPFIYKQSFRCALQFLYTSIKSEQGAPFLQIIPVHL